MNSKNQMKNRLSDIVRLTKYAAIVLMLGGAGCGNSAPSSDQSQSGPDTQGDVATDAIVNSVADGCGAETFVGPFKGFELPLDTGRNWSQNFEYTSGLGDELVSGYEEHSSSVSANRDARCDKLFRVFEAAPVADGSTTTYAIALKLTATTTAFPISYGEVQRTPTIPTTLSARFAVEVLAPCPNNQSCWEAVIPEQDFPATLQCKTSPILKRKNVANPGSAPADALACSHFPFVVSADFDIGYAALASSSVKDVVMPDSVATKYRGYHFEA